MFAVLVDVFDMLMNALGRSKAKRLTMK